MLLCKIEMYLAAEIIIIYQDFSAYFFLRQLESFYRLCYVHVI